MHHGRHLTPLGKQLRTVLKSLSAAAKSAPSQRRTESTSSRPAPARLFLFDHRCDGARGSAHGGNPSSVERSHASADDTARGVEAANEPPNAPSSPARRFLFASEEEDDARLMRYDMTVHRRWSSVELDAALASVGLEQSLSYAARIGQRYTGHVDKSKQDWYARWKARQNPTDVGSAPVVPETANGREPSRLYAMTAAAIRQDAMGDEGNDLRLSMEDQMALEACGYQVDDLQAWSQALKEPDAETALQTLTRHDESGATPLFVYLYILRRPDLSGRAIREAWDYLRILVDRLAENDNVVEVTQFAQPLQMISARLVDHALTVWPQALPAIIDLVLECDSVIERRRPVTTEDHLSSTTHFLNSLMGQISLPSKQLPFKAIDYKHEAIVRILRYLSERQPGLHVNREGYRAVIRIQLAQRKTSQEQEWAELKALSWPPWKHDRTGMDADIGPEHGISCAGATLKQMREAGYPWEEWEQIAGVYAGWDTDYTPTIQTRTLLGRPRPQDANDEDLWTARIAATRTVQEAWACYLSWEDAKFPPAQGVYLAIFKKIVADKIRKLRIGSDAEQDQDGDTESPAWPLYPGDTLTVEPLPPSTHLETYTRTSPPTMDQLYEQLHARGIQFQRGTLAYLVANADDVSLGFKYLSNAASYSPDLRPLLSRNLSVTALSKTQEQVLIATIDLLCRFPHLRFSRILPDRRSSIKHNPSLIEPTPLEPLPLAPTTVFSTWHLSPNSCIARAIDLLRTRPLPNHHAWHALLENLNRPAYFELFRHALNSLPGFRLMRTPTRGGFWQDHANRHDAGAMIAYTLTRETLTLAHANHISPDTLIFESLCRATEKMTLASCSLLHRLGEHPSSSHGTHWPQIQAECQHFLSTTAPAVADLQTAFLALTCPLEPPPPSSSPRPSSSRLPRLVTPPNPALLHAYIRALGALHASAALLDLLTWMHTYRDEILERQHLDRHGARMMRRALVAVRVFLERKFISLERTSLFGDSPRRRGGDAGELVRRLRAPAGEEVIEKIRALLESEDMKETWGGWPTEEECTVYCWKMHEAGSGGLVKFNESL